MSESLTKLIKQTEAVQEWRKNWQVAVKHLSDDSSDVSITPIPPDTNAYVRQRFFQDGLMTQFTDEMARRGQPVSVSPETANMFNEMGDFVFGVRRGITAKKPVL